MSEVVTGPKGITPERVVDAAIELTHDVGLGGWSIRELSGRLGVAPSAVYHHVGSREVVLARVAASLVARVECPDPELDWKLWFARLLDSIRATLRDYPGVAHWFMMHGPSIPETTAIVDAGIGVLERAGFGENAAFAYGLLLNYGAGSLAFSQDRAAVGAPDGDRALAELLPKFTGLRGDSHGMAVLTDHLLTPSLSDPGEQERSHRLGLQVLFRGLAAEFLD